MKEGNGERLARLLDDKPPIAKKLNDEQYSPEGLLRRNAIIRDEWPLVGDDQVRNDGFSRQQTLRAPSNDVDYDVGELI